jgi:hypothetical protein
VNPSGRGGRTPAGRWGAARLEAHQIAPGLWQGSNPRRGPMLSQIGFRTLVLCAMERQYPSSEFPGLEVVHAPMDDSAVVPVKMAHRAAEHAARAVVAGHKVLVVCNMGKNRSGLVAALALWYLTGAHGHVCVRRVQAARPIALDNRYFVDYLKTLLPRHPQQRR